MKIPGFLVAASLVIAAVAVLAGCSGNAGQMTALPGPSGTMTANPAGTGSSVLPVGPAEPDISLSIPSAQKVATVQGISPNRLGEGLVRYLVLPSG